ncbi:MAG: virulence RhuM family protein [Candidatus Omnitrophica bacterium]|nr:virulence RhuM family protein [Candidatus Omnitrophota bacterium]MBU4457929.1 virulence RhuM family protein [Candidatus Omnitrophota bacterium]
MHKKEPNNSQLIIYQTETGKTKIDVRFQDETVWLSQQLMAELFHTTKQNISLHVKNIFEEGELQEDSVVKDFLTTASDGKSYRTKFYNLDMIISVGYRIKSKVATHFRQWATRHLREFIVKGFVLDDERLKNPQQPFDYFDELVKRIQDIRTSERRFYQKITDIYATSVDYDPTDEMSIEFFKTVQNKMHWAITGQTAAEVIYDRVDSKKKNMGLTNWRGTKIRKDDVTIAKNYLNEEELLGLNNLVEQYLIFAEGQAMRRIPMHMKDWIKKLDGFLQLNEREILAHAGKISHQLAVETAETEYDKYAKKRQLAYDKKGNAFDMLVNETKMIEDKSKRKK